MASETVFSKSQSSEGMGRWGRRAPYPLTPTLAGTQVQLSPHSVPPLSPHTSVKEKQHVEAVSFEGRALGPELGPGQRLGSQARGAASLGCRQLREGSGLHVTCALQHEECGVCPQSASCGLCGEKEKGNESLGGAVVQAHDCSTGSAESGPGSPWSGPRPTPPAILHKSPCHGVTGVQSCFQLGPQNHTGPWERGTLRASWQQPPFGV